MKEFNKDKYNRLCAEFLGYRLITPEMRKNPKNWYINGEPSSYWQKDFPEKQDVLCGEKALSFDSDWNWIHEVIEAIEKKSKHVIMNRDLYDSFDIGKEAVVQAIWQFLLWYNEQNK